MYFRLQTKALIRTALLAAAIAACAQAQITVYSSGNVDIGTTRQLSAYVPLSPNTVVWAVNGVAGGTATYGTVSANGLYSAPSVAPAANAVTVTATSTAYPKVFGQVTLNIVQPTPWVWSVSPSSIPVGPFKITLGGSNFTQASVAQFGGVALPTTYISATQLTATGTAMPAQVGTVGVTVLNAGNGAITSQAKNVTVTAPPVTIKMDPTSASVGLGLTKQFTATVTGAVDTSVNWAVNGVAGGNTTVGTISTGGLYTAPASMPSPATVTVKATSVASSTSSAQATVTLTAPPPPAPVLTTVAPVSIPQGAFSITLTGSNFAASSQVRVNGVALTTTYVSATQLTAAGSTIAAPGSSIPVNVTNPGPPSQTSNNVNVTIAAPASGISYTAAARFLEQAAFGPTPAEIGRVQQMGFDAWIEDQFTKAESPITMPAGNTLGPVQDELIWRMMHGQDQLRQKLVYALGNIVVISANKNIYPPEIVPYLQILSKHAFGSYRNLIREISQSSQMGKYLDLANSAKAGVSGGANENYPRELLQLFTIGLVELNPDGTPKLDAYGKPIPTYTQATVGQFARALTGWTYPTAAGQTPRAMEWENFTGPMQPREQNHDTTAKTLLNGATLPAGQTTTQDMDGAIDNIFQHQNIGPFIATRLIKAFVTSNPSPGYVARVAAAFTGGAVKGDLKAAVKALLLDAEAKTPVDANAGKLKEPLVYFANFTRAMGGTFTPGAAVSYEFSRIGQTPLTPPSVFSFFSPMYRIPKSALSGPEFQIYTPTESVLRANMLWYVMTSQYGSGWKIDLTPFNSVASDPQALIDAVDGTLLYGRMPAAFRQSLLKAINAAYDNTQRVQTAVYLTALSGQYSVQF